MNLLESLSSSPFALHVGWLLVHAVWQATLIAAGLAAVLALIDERSARIRYALSTTALAFMLLLPLATAFTASPVPRTAYVVPAVAVGYLAGEGFGAMVRVSVVLRRVLSDAANICRMAGRLRPYQNSPQRGARTCIPPVHRPRAAVWTHGGSGLPPV